MNNLTVIYYTSNYLEEKNPTFLANTKKQLVKAIDGLPLIVVSQKPVPKFEGYEGEYTNICLGDIGRSHLNIYYQIWKGCQAARTPLVAMAEDDILYSYEHFHAEQYFPTSDVFMYDMNKLSLFTWTKPPLFSFRHNRMVVNQLISPTKMLEEAMAERFEHLKVLRTKWPEERILKLWGDPGRYENQLGVTVRNTKTFMCTCPSIVFSHQFAYGYEFNQGKRKRLGDLRILEVPYWGRAEEVLKQYYEKQI